MLLDKRKMIFNLFFEVMTQIYDLRAQRNNVNVRKLRKETMDEKQAKKLVAKVI